jgi:hypothetical protein
MTSSSTRNTERPESPVAVIVVESLPISGKRSQITRIDAMRVSASGRPKMAFAAGPLQADLWSNTAAKRYHGFLSRNRILAPGLSDACDDPAL